MKTKKLLAIATITTALSTGFYVTSGSAATQTPAQLNKIIATLKKEVTQLKTSLSAANKKIKAYRASIAQKDATITVNNKSIAAYIAEITKKDATISNQTNTIAQKDATITANNKAITGYVADIAEKDTTISNQTNTIAQKDAQINALNKKIVELSPKADTSLPGHSINKPVGLFTPVTLGADDYDGKRLYDITMLELISGAQAWNMINDDNSYNDEPKAGYHYVIAKFKINNIKVLSNAPFALREHMFEAVSKEGFIYDSTYVSISNEFDTKVYLGGTFEGYVTFEVKDGDTPLIVMNQGDEDEGWFTTAN